jgi:hypothetical protein
MPVPLWMESVMRLLLPPACREHVLGDLHERNASARQYVAEALSVIAPVIVSTIRRTTDFNVLTMEALAIYASYSTAAWYLRQRVFLYEDLGFARLAIPTTLAVVGLLLSNAYSDLAKQSPAKAVMQSGGSLALAFLGQAALFDTVRGLAVPFPVMAFGSCAAFVLVSTLRMMFPPMEKRPKFVSSGPTSLQQAAFSSQLRHLADESPQPSNRLVYIGLIVLAIVLGLSIWRNFQY